MEDSVLPAAGLASLLLGIVFQGLESHFRVLSSRDSAISCACDEGVNIDLLAPQGTDIARELTFAHSPGDFPLVCVKGVVKTYDRDVIRGLTSRESSPLRGLDSRPCAISIMSTADNYENNRDIGTVTSRSIEQVPWCLTSYDSRSPKIVMDQESVRQTLQSSLVVPSQEPQTQLQTSCVLNDIANRRKVGYFRPAGVEKIPRTWWQFFTFHPQQTLISHILPVLTKCCMIGSITLNTDGDYLLTAHPKYGFYFFSDIAFAPMAAAHRASSLYWGQVAYRCGLLGSCCFSVFVLSVGLFAYTKYQPGSLSRAWWSFVTGSDDQPPPPNPAPASAPARTQPSPFSLFAPSAPSSSALERCARILEGHDRTRSLSVTSDMHCPSPTRNMNMCVICLSEARTVLVRPCLHLCMCATCCRDNYADDNRNDDDDIYHNDYSRQADYAWETRECPICREAIESFEEIYNP